MILHGNYNNCSSSKTKKRKIDIGFCQFKSPINFTHFNPVPFGAAFIHDNGFKTQIEQDELARRPLFNRYTDKDYTNIMDEQLAFLHKIHIDEYDYPFNIPITDSHNIIKVSTIPEIMEASIPIQYSIEQNIISKEFSCDNAKLLTNTESIFVKLI